MAQAGKASWSRKPERKLVGTLGTQTSPSFCDQLKPGICTPARFSQLRPPPVLLWLPVSLNECLTSLYFSLLNYYNFSYHYTHKWHSRKSLFTHNNTTKPYKDNSNINYSFHRTRGLRLKNNLFWCFFQERRCSFTFHSEKNCPPCKRKQMTPNAAEKQANDLKLTGF